MTTATENVKTPEESGHGHRHLGWALVLISVAQLMVVLDSTIANIALPHIVKDLDISPSNQSWIITGYALAFGGLLLLGGRLGDLYGRRRYFSIGVAIFAVASLLGGLAQSEAMLLGARGLQGLGAAIASPTALALITTTFPAGAQRNRAFAVYAAMSGAGGALGLILGGWLTEYSWRWTFLIVVPIGIGAALIAPYLLGESEKHPGELDLPGAVTGTLGLLAVVFGFTRAGDPAYGWDHVSTILSLVGGVLLLGAFILIERHVAHPLMPFRILADRTRGTSFVVMALVPAAMFAMFYFLTQYIQNVMGYSSLKAGVAFLPFTLGIVFGAGLASKLVAKIDPRWLSGVGTLMAAAALFGFSRIPYDAVLPGIGSSATYAGDILPFILLMAVGMGLVFVPLTLTAVHGVSDHDSGIGSGVLNAMQQVGGALGLAMLSTVAVSAVNDKVAEIGAAAAKLGPNSGLPADPAAAQLLIGQVAFTEGAVAAFLTGAGMILLGSAITFLFLNVKASELAGDGPPDEDHIG